MNLYVLPIKKIFLLLFLVVSINFFSQTADFAVQHIQHDVTNTSSRDESITTVSLNSAVALANNNRKTHAGDDNPGANTSYDGDDLAGARYLLDADNLRYVRQIGSSVNNMRFNTSILEYVGPAGGDNEMIVRGRYAVTLNGGTNSVLQSITSGATGYISDVVNAEDCVPFITGIMNCVIT